MQTDSYVSNLSSIERRDVRSMSFYFCCAYLFLEYIRPQTMYDSLSGLPLNLLALIGLITSMFIEGYGLKTRHKLNTLIPFYFMVALLSALFGVSFQDSQDALIGVLTWVVVYFLLINVIDSKDKFRIAILALLLFHFKMSQYTVRHWVSSGFSYNKYGWVAGAGFFNNAGDYGVAMSVIFPIGAYYFISVKKDDILKVPYNLSKFFWGIVALSFIAAILACSSRGAAVALGASLFFILLKSKRKSSVTIIVAFLIIAFLGIASEAYKSRFSTAGDDETSQDRIHLWKQGLKMAEISPVIGVGINNFVLYNTKYLGDDNQHVSHNIFIQCLSETGFAGLSILLFMIIQSFLTNRDTRKLIIENNLKDKELFLYNMANALDVSTIAFMVSGFFLTVLYYPFFWINMSLIVALNSIVKNRANS